ncbi:MAG: hypothetical protein L6Q54_14535 [Leptospiraceae bacterium]|nr:hypothetical protein [Leptospiraceae bacterium]MCK6382450.1 hypothetical protein [Leptospiraceae bacterium]NUM42527.1 hypothetical protein [Leptospiraceae bacterium]
MILNRNSRNFFVILILFIFPVIKILGQTKLIDTKEEKKGNLPKNSLEIYEDTETGQVFTKPGTNRKKIRIISDSEIEKIEPFPNTLVNRPSNLKNEKLTIVGRLQVHGVSGQIQSAYNNGHRDFNSVDWSIRRARLGFMYAGDKWWGTTINLRLENAFASPYLTPGSTTSVCADSTCSTKANALTSQPSLKDARGLIQNAFIYVNLPFHIRVSVGMINLQFNREMLMSSSNFIALERTLIANALPLFDNGISFQWMPLADILGKKYERYLTLSGMISDGHGGGGNNGFGRRIDTTYSRSGTVPVIISPLYTGRIQYNVFGGLINENGKDLGWQEGEEIFQSEMKWSIGAAITETKNYKVIGSNFPIEAQPRNMETLQLTSYQASPVGGTTPTSSANSALLNTSVDFTSQNTKSGANLARANMGLVAHNYDTTFTYKHFYLNGAISYFSGAASNNIRSHHITVGYNIPVLGKWIMPVARYDFLKADFNRDGNYSQNEIFKLYWVGLNFFGDRHLFKAQLFFNVIKDELGTNAYRQSYDLNNNQIFFQLQGTFWTGVTPPDKLETRVER